MGGGSQPIPNAHWTPVQFVLTVPTALDRFVQQAVLQVLQPIFDPTFSDHSYGFRPGRSAHQAVAAAQKHVASGYRWVVDLDLEKFFDRVNHDLLMGRLAQRVTDTRALKLVRAGLNAGGRGKGGGGGASWENGRGFSRSCGRVLCVHSSGSVHGLFARARFAIVRPRT